MRIPLSAPDVIESDIEAVAAVLRTRTLSLGEKLEGFERGVREYVGTAHAVGVSSGTAGLHLCVKALGIGDGDEVIVPSFSFAAVANCVRYERGIPVFVDISEKTLNLDPAAVQRAIGPRTRGILMVHTFGRPAEMEELLGIARRNGLFVIEDACEAIGAEYNGRKVGGFGNAGVFAFYPNKQMTTGEGGMVTTNDARLAARVKALRNQGRGDADGWLQHSEVGFNYRISEMNCALGVGQLKRIDEILTRRAEVAAQYEARLGKLDGLQTPDLHLARGKMSWFVYVVRLGERFTRTDRDWICGEMGKRGIGCGKYFPPIHLQPAYGKEPSRKTELTVTERVGDRTLALPFFNRITDGQIAEVCDTLAELMEKCGK
jgi:perosamine synthetase